MPLEETLTKFNWIDIFVISLVLITSYKGAKKGFVIEIFKLSGVVLSFYAALHYFSQASDSLLEYFPNLGIIFSDFACFAFLALVSYLSMAAIREILRRFFKTEATTGLNRWGGLILGFIRGIFLASLLLISFYFLGVNYLRGSVKKSYLGSRMVLTDVKVYEFIFGGIVSKFTPDEKLNKDIYEVLEEGDE